MRRVIFLAALAVLPGCQGLWPGLGPNATTGWKFEVGTPSTLTVPATAVVQQGSTATAAMPLTAAIAPTTISGSPASPVLAALAASPCAPAYPAPAFAATVPQPGCTLEDVCKKLGLIEQRISILETYKTMPKGAP
jgi:hypothetical protein